MTGKALFFIEHATRITSEENVEIADQVLLDFR